MAGPTVEDSAMRQIQLDWSRLLGFDQAKPGSDVLREAAKVGTKPCVRDADTPVMWMVGKET